MSALDLVYLVDFEKLRKTNISFLMPVFFFCLSVHPSVWNNSAPTGWIFMKSDIPNFFSQKSVEKIEVPLKCNEINVYFTWKPMYVYDNISFSPS